MDGKQIADAVLAVSVFQPAAERKSKPESFNNLFVKNFPPGDYTDTDLRAVFESYGPITSCHIDATNKFGFVCFAQPEHAAKALEHLGESEAVSALYVSRAMKKDVRRKVLRVEMLKSMRQVARQNLYFKGFPVDESADDLSEELKIYFGKFGEVKNLKLMQRTVEVEGASREEMLGFGYVSFHTLESA